VPGPNDRSLNRNQIEGWLGVNNVLSETTLPKDYLRQATNVDLDNQGKPQRRRGYTARFGDPGKNQIWAGARFPYLLHANNGTLFAVDQNEVATSLTPVVQTDPLTFCEINDNVFWSDGSTLGLITPTLDLFPAYTPNPTQQPAVAVLSSGGYPAGHYQVAMTYVDALGRESGTDVARQGDVPEGGGLQLTFPVVPADVVFKRVYVSTMDGEDLFLVRQFPAAVSSAVLGPLKRSSPLRTQFTEPMMAGHILRYFNTRLYVAQHNRIFNSEPLRYGQFAPVDVYFTFRGRVRMLEPVGEAQQGSGLFVSDEKRTYFLDGAEPKAFQQKVAYPYPAVEGTSTSCPGTYLGLDVTTLVAYWLATNGVFCIGMPGGLVVPMSETYALARQAQAGVSYIRDIAGIRQIVTNISGLGGAQLAAATDSVVGRVERNGVVVQ
jgi:hypothetical protein